MNWTTVVGALLGLVGGVVSGGFTAYTQLSSAEQRYSIDRADKFKELFGDLHDEEKSRIALLNLWQLYPDKRDQKIIVAAAVETGQSDLIETIVGFEEEISQYSGILQTKALRAAETEKADELIRNPAMRLLSRVDAPKAAEVLVEYLDRDIRDVGDRYVSNEITREISGLVRADPNVDDRIRTVYQNVGEMPMLVDYLLFSSGSESAFVERLRLGFEQRTNLLVHNSFLRKVDFRGADPEPVVATVKATIVAGLTGPEIDSADIEDSIVALKNQTLAETIRGSVDDPFSKSIHNAVVDADLRPSLRAASLELAHRISPELAQLAIARVLADSSAEGSLAFEIERQLVEIIARNERGVRTAPLPEQCLDDDPSACMMNADGWSAWLASVESKFQ